MSSITKLKRKFKKNPAFITCAASQSHDSIKTNITFKVPLQISTELFSVCRLLQKIQQTTYKSKEDFKPLSVLTFSRPILHRHRFLGQTCVGGGGGEETRDGVKPPDTDINPGGVIPGFSMKCRDTP